ncbi:phosphotransferase family protein [Streptomyces spectabilis]|uniref:Aminoglycoside phosphotransferase (APT) family kinase protein n=1 Tax=Streptomyces spectabilis TaxID=68270 RepID=A0A7W8B4Y0_STRST|nr:aminoglycoside phosphotransferase family protein [Streptomyces spectabilis]MBB5108952.1 aminoglycoside phosphotransferase (APT) family kinase protein [Streptomyces spectabilis]GGV50355.1 aminoglycoside phosphotransferase [Streptomyces spectabilis]
MTRSEESFAILQEATSAAGLSPEGAEPIRLAENDLWRLPGGVVVRIARAGQEAAAAREVAVARWLADNNVPAVRPMPWDQPLHAGGRAATFWELLPPHRHGTEADLAPLLRRMHELPTPSFPIGRVQPFVRVADRIAAARSVSDGDRQWLLIQLEELQHRWDHLPASRPHCVIHGDAWGGNCAVTSEGTARLMDFERTSLGPPEWDLTSTAVAHDTFGTVSAERYTAYCERYGYDVMNWAGYTTLRGIRELRLATFALQIADHDAEALEQAHYRIACLRGLQGPRPWQWQPVG